MAEKSEILITPEEKLAQAKELFGRGSRNYCMKQYSDAADDLSACCALYSEIHGSAHAELGLPYLLYAKSLIALGTEENKLLAAEDEEGEADGEYEEGEEGDEEGGEEDAEGAVDGETEAMDEGETKENEEDANEAKPANGSEAEAAPAVKADEADSVTNGQAPAEANVEAVAVADEQEAGPSISNGAAKEDITEETEEDEKGNSNLEVAWEVLELAVKIFAEQGDKASDNLVESLTELAGISFENSNFEIAITDYVKALDVFENMPVVNQRIIAEIQYKIGLSHMMLNQFDLSIEAFKRACDMLDKEIEDEKKKEESDDQKLIIQDLEETKQEVLVKITEVEESKLTSTEEIKRELSKYLSEMNGIGADASSASNTKLASPPAAEKPKATDISHLIKRKKPDTKSTEVEGSPAKKTAMEVENGASSTTKA